MASAMEKKIRCPSVTCKAMFTKFYNMNRHYERFHLNNDMVEKCLLCGMIFSSCEELQKHYKRIHKPTKKFLLKESAFRKSVSSYRYTFASDDVDFKSAQYKALPAILNLLQLEASQKILIKVSLIFICEMSMLDHVGGKMQTTLIPFRAPSFIANGHSKSSIKKNVLRSFMLQERDMEEFCNCGSNWVFDKAVAFDVEIAAMRPILVGNNPDMSQTSDETSVEDSEISDLSTEEDTFNFYDPPRKRSPDPFDEPEEFQLHLEKEKKKKKKIAEFYDSERAVKLEFNVKSFKNAKFLFNPQNKDEKCFLYCLHEHMKTVNPQKFSCTSFKMFEKSLNLTGIIFPISIQQVKTFLKRNQQLGIRVNILFRNTNKHLFPLEYGLGKKSSKHTMNIILVQRKIKNDVNNHFLLIKDINKFTRQVYGKSDNDKMHSYGKSFLCCNCLNRFSSDKILKKHEKICSLNKPRLENADGTGICFQNHHHMHPLEYIAFLDFECVLPKVSTRCPECTHLRCKCDRSFTAPMTEQYPVTYSLVILDQNSQIIHDVTHSSPNAADHLIDHLLKQEEDWISNLFKTVYNLEMTSKDWYNFNKATNCYMCNIEFAMCDIKPRRDHCHFSGKYLGAACNMCNLKRQRPRKLHIYLHNGSKYDFHFIIKALNNKKKVKNIQILPYNGENFRTISFNSFIFLDSMSFLQSSLAKLSEDLTKTDNSYSILRQTYLVQTNNVFDKHKFKMVTGKSFFPYEFWYVIFFTLLLNLTVFCFQF